MPEHPDLQDEQEFLNRAYDGLEFMRGEARQMLQGVLDLGRGGTFQSRTERDIVVRTSLARLEQLDIGDQALYFGRIDRLPEPGRRRRPANPLLGESFHIGRLAVSGPDHEPLVVDWRAPVAEPFYRATGLDPQGLARRRHLAVRGRTVLGLEDEYFVDPEGRAGVRRAGRSRRRAVPATAGSACCPTGWSWAAPARSSPPWARRGRARWATSSATIQREQDEIIRSPLPGVLVVQGGPGTGQDGGGAAPRRLPALHPPLPARAPGRARRRAEPAVPALHRAGPALARRDRGQPVDGRRAWCPRCACAASTTPPWPS